MIPKFLKRLETRLFHVTRYPPYRAIDERYEPEYFWNMLAGLRDHYLANGWSDNFSAYEDLIARLRDLPGIRLVPLRELMSAPPDGRTVLALRYDIDADPEVAVRIARFNARFGICGSFYLLHTAYYYGIYHGMWCRNAPMLREWVRDLIVAGAEIGLHLDPLSVYAEHNMDGAQAVRTELEYLRGLGARIDGVVAHNSIAVHGAENFEIFRGKTIWRRRKIRIKGERWVPLGVLSEEQCGIAYEGNYSIPVSPQPTAEARAWLNAPLAPEAANQGDWMRLYLLDNPCYRRAYDACVWHNGSGAWTVAARPAGGKPIWMWKMSQAEMLSALNDLPAGTRVSMVIHPVSFSADQAPKKPASG